MRSPMPGSIHGLLIAAFCAVLLPLSGMLLYALSRTSESASQTAYLIGGVAMLLAGLLLSSWYIRHITVPILQILEAGRGLEEGLLEQPIPLHGPAEVRALGQVLERLRERLIALEQDNSTFLRQMSHELKTPLASICEGTEILSDGTLGGLSSRQHQVVDILHESGQELQHLIENLLSFSAWKTRQVHLQLIPLRIKQLLTQVSEAHHLALLAKRLQLHIHAEDVAIKADQEKIRIMLDNLLSNAIRFSPAESDLWINVELHSNTVTIDVADSGPGIEMHEREHIFQPFYRGKAPESGSLYGSGIGLSVVRECVQAHGGQIEIIDGIYQGAQFRISLPVDPTTAIPRHRHMQTTPVVQTRLNRR